MTLIGITKIQKKEQIVLKINLMNKKEMIVEVASGVAVFTLAFALLIGIAIVAPD